VDSEIRLSPPLTRRRWLALFSLHESLSSAFTDRVSLSFNAFSCVWFMLPLFPCWRGGDFLFLADGHFGARKYVLLAAWPRPFIFPFLPDLCKPRPSLCMARRLKRWEPSPLFCPILSLLWAEFTFPFIDLFGTESIFPFFLDHSVPAMSWFRRDLQGSFPRCDFS